MSPTLLFLRYRAASPQQLEDPVILLSSTLLEYTFIFYNVFDKMCKNTANNVYIVKILYNDISQYLNWVMF